MPRQRSKERDAAFILYRDSGGKRALVDIAKELNVPDAQVRKWKSTDKWDEKMKGIDPIRKQTKKIKTSETKRIDPIPADKDKKGIKVFVNGKEMKPIDDEPSEKKERKKQRKGRVPLWESMNMVDMLDAVRGWCMQGSTDVEICEMLGISHTTFYEWKNDYPAFAEATKKGKCVANGELLNAAFRQATGYRYMEQQVVKVRSTDLRTGLPIDKIEIVEVEKVMPPNPTMQIFMMKNRMPEAYKDKQEIAHSGQVTTVDSKEITIIQEVIQQDNEIANKFINGIRTARLGANRSD